jgi:ribonucleoside-diphosphate reductase alpha chain
MLVNNEIISGTDEFVSKYTLLSEERKRLQVAGELPEWVITPGYQMLKSKYLEQGETFKDRVTAISKCAAAYMPDSESWHKIFFELIWSGQLALSTPILSSMGRGKGCPVSCASSSIGDSVYDFYSSQLEAAMLSKNGFGTSSYLGDIRPRGSIISGSKEVASGVLPVYKDFVQVASDINQGSRRGAWAGYLPVDHPDFYEVYNYIHKHPDGANIGWCISDSFIERLNEGDEVALGIYQDVLKLRMTSGKGYLWFPDKVNRMLPNFYSDKGMTNKGSNLCNEVLPVILEDETFTCILSSLNALYMDDWDSCNTIFNSFVFLHCVALNFIDIGKDIPGLDKAINYTRNHMSLGLGLLGFHSLLQSRGIAFESLDAQYLNSYIFKQLNSVTYNASKFLAEIFGEAPIAKDYGVANALRIAIAPNLSSALICGGLSQGIEPIYKNVYIQHTAAGKVTRVNPQLLLKMKGLDLNIESELDKILDNSGSVKDVEWLTDDDKLVFRTAFEIDQKIILRLASQRQRYIDQGQSINLFFSADESEEYISEVHSMAILDPNIKGLYYVRSETGIQVNKNECISCEG